VRNLRNNSFQAAGPKLFNALPADIRDHSGSPEAFKNMIDQYLQLIPDHPIIPGGLLPAPLNQMTAVNTNSITDWTRHLSLNTRRKTRNLPITDLRKMTSSDNNHSAVTDLDNSIDIHSVVIDL
jgi:hypothetical protein